MAKRAYILVFTVALLIVFSGCRPGSQEDEKPIGLAVDKKMEIKRG
jgi:hypothetical protein